MTKTPQTADELNKQFDSQIELLKVLVNVFDKGDRVVAKSIATTIRVLLHDTSSSHSLLSQLNLKGRNFFDSSTQVNEIHNMQIVGSFCGLVGISVGGSYTYNPYLDDIPGKPQGFVVFDKYWNKTIFIDNKKNKYTRKEIILALANQDGGAHVDPKIDNKYKQLARENSLGWKVSADGKMWNDTNGAELAATRQIAHELLRTFIPDYPKQKMVETGSGFTIGGMGLIFSKGKEVVSNIMGPHKKNEKIGRNEKCPCGSGLKYKKCHGK